MSMVAIERCWLHEATAQSCAMSSRALRVIDAAEEFSTQVQHLLKLHKGHISNAGQLSRAASGVSGNLSEGFGRGPGAEREHSFRIARGECEEALTRLRDAHHGREISSKDFYPLSNRGVVIIRMINALLH